MINLKKVLFFLSSLFLGIDGVFAAGILTGSLQTTFTDFNQNIIGDPNVMYFIFFTSILFGTFTIFKGALRFSFKEKSNFHQKEINVISFMLSIIGTSGLFFLFKERGPEYVVKLFGGVLGLLIILIVAIILMRGFIIWANTFPKDKKFLRLAIYWTGALFTFGMVDSYIWMLAKQLTGLPDWLDVLRSIIDFSMPILVIGAIILGFMGISKLFSFKEANKSSEQKNRDGIKKSLHKIAESSNHINEILYNNKNSLKTNLDNLKESFEIYKNETENNERIVPSLYSNGGQ